MPEVILRTESAEECFHAWPETAWWSDGLDVEAGRSGRGRHGHGMQSAKKLLSEESNNSGIFSIEVTWYPLTYTVAMEIL